MVVLGREPLLVIQPGALSGAPSKQWDKPRASGQPCLRSAEKELLLLIRPPHPFAKPPIANPDAHQPGATYYKAARVDPRAAVSAAFITMWWLGARVTGSAQLPPCQAAAFWASVLLQAALPYAAAFSKIFYRHHSQLVIGLRLLQPAVVLLLERYSVPPAAAATQLAPPLTFGAFVLHSLLSSKAALLAAFAFSSRMPFERHLALHSLSLAAIVLGNLGTCTKICSTHQGPSLQPHLLRMMRHLSLLAAPAFAITGLGGVGQLREMLTGPAIPRFQCWLVWSFLALLFGALAPTLLLFLEECAARRRHVQRSLLAVQRQQAEVAAPATVHGSDVGTAGSWVSRGGGSGMDRALDHVLGTACTNLVFLGVAGLAGAWIVAMVAAAMIEAWVIAL